MEELAEGEKIPRLVVVAVVLVAVEMVEKMIGMGGGVMVMVEMVLCR